MDRVFLDANVLFSAAYRREGGLSRLWDLVDVSLMTSHFAAEEARRNLDTAAQGERLERPLSALELVPEAPDRTLPEGSRLPRKDRPILQAAIAAGATHLLTGDVTHFGPYYGQDIAGVRIESPGDYLKRRERSG